jgi:hypothetical protein
VAFWVFRDLWRESATRWVGLCLYPALSGISLILLGAYAMTTFDVVTDLVGIGGLLFGIVFFRPQRFTIAARPA